MSDSKEIIREKAIKDLNLVIAGGKRKERVFDCLRAVKSYNLILQMTSTPNVFFNRSIFTFKRIKKKSHVTGMWRLIIPSTTLVYVQNFL